MVKEHTMHLIRARMSEQTALVIGDLMIDEYLFGAAERISPEAPVPVVSINRRSYRAGGAGNVALNLAALGIKVRVAGFIGSDPEGSLLTGILQEAGVDTSAVVTLEAPLRTIRKSRLMAGNQQVVRFDCEQQSVPLPRHLEALEQALANALDECPAIVVLSDYAKGTLTEGICQSTINKARDGAALVYVDPKGTDFARYRGATAITPNLKELKSLMEASGQSQTDRAVFCQQLRSDLKLERLIVTLGAEGMEGYCDQQMYHSPAKAREVFDVSGAGDTAIAVTAACHASGIDFRDCLAIANAASGVAVQKMGTVAVEIEELLDVLDAGAAAPRCVALDPRKLHEKILRWQEAGDRVVFTNGCFDILHAGHVRLLTAAASYGTKLVVALNSDLSVTRLKGVGRPFVTQDDRSLLIAALSCVDAVTLFDSGTPLELIELLGPDVLVKGADYKPAEIVGYDAVTSRGGEVVVIPLAPDRSTTLLAQKVRAGESSTLETRPACTEDTP